MGKEVGYYPKGAINQHKAMAADDPGRMAKSDTSNKETVPDPWGSNKGVPGKVRKSGTSTGSMSRHGTISHKVTPA